MDESQLKSMTGAGELLGVGRHAIAALVRAWGIEPKRMSNGRAKGVDQDDIQILAAALNMDAPADATD
jgi:hypothetical protein